MDKPDVMNAESWMAILALNFCPDGLLFPRPSHDLTLLVEISSIIALDAKAELCD
jgi:hypothetical protein